VTALAGTTPLTAEVEVTAGKPSAVELKK
jgi:hypothetical protein